MSFLALSTCVPVECQCYTDRLKASVHMRMQSVTIYSTPTCHFCHMAKEFFTENKVEYTEHDVAADMEKRNEMIEKSGQMGVPVIMIGSELVVGFDEDTLREKLGL